MQVATEKGPGDTKTAVTHPDGTSVVVETTPAGTRTTVTHPDGAGTSVFTEGMAAAEATAPPACASQQALMADHTSAVVDDDDDIIEDGDGSTAEEKTVWVPFVSPPAEQPLGDSLADNLRGVSLGGTADDTTSTGAGSGGQGPTGQMTEEEEGEPNENDVACVAAEGHKAAGTALFKAGKFLAAEREYSAGIAEIWGVDLASVSSPREYVLDLQFSLALNAGENSRTDPELRSFSSIPSPLLLAFCQLVYAADTRRIVAAAAATSARGGHGRWTAAAQLKLEDHAAALASSEKALGKVTDPGDLRQVKALYRKGAALLSLGRVAEAKNTLTMAYKLDSTNKQVSNLLKRAMKAEVRRHRWSGR